LKTRGFAGCPHTLRDWLQEQYGRKRERVLQQTPPPRISPRKAAWQVLKEPQQEQHFLDELCLRAPQIAAFAATAREFCRIIRERDMSACPQWKRIAANGPLAGFAKHLCHDESAFFAAL
jgi:hypothetical protein